MNLIHYEDENSRYLALASAEKDLCMLACWVEDPDSDSFKRHLARVADYLWVAEDGMTLQGRHGGVSAWEPPTSPSRLQSRHWLYLGNLSRSIGKKEIENFIKNTCQFIEHTQTSDRSWLGFWGVCYIYGTWFALNGLAAAGKNYSNCLAMRRGVDFLLSKQNEDGG
ncbi:hypothetical protein L6164_002603 [Bauhinia variegata]|uniref:Uncharacterized protein n=1 Tax=Bauhinia variegata TaxID=167791 RepID=A0ACB9Q1E4_BAUVA|nr:hypothetical protein L6164_002603 [Bauhinia variegata]